jgi:chromosomal replication initiation ATPase DnaA
VTVKGPKVSFPRVLQAVATVTGHSPDLLVRTGRQRDRVAARALLVYAGREWSGLSVKELGRRLHRDPSMISRLYAHYVAARSHSWEKRVLELLKH